MRITDHDTERFRAESRLRALTAPVPTGPPSPGPFRPGDPFTPPAGSLPPGGPFAPPAGPLRTGGPLRSGGLSPLADDPSSPGAPPPGGPAARPRSAPVPPSVPTSFEALRTAIAAQAPALAPSGPGLRLLLLVALAAAVAGGLYAWRSQPRPEPLTPPVPVSGAPLAAPAPPPPSASPDLARQGPEPPGPGAAGAGRPPGAVPEVVVHVTGKVRRPGVITLPVGSRVTDAVRAAGGVRRGAGTGHLNLARRLVDGEQIDVGAPGPAAAPPAGADPAEAVIDLNTATPQQLEQLPGVGEVLARRIVEYRDGHGGFRAVEQLREVSGIGDRKYAEMKDRVRV
ncbi:helix-hairpin-helix domain-containing protein [Streptosporangium sandarakinum]|uniref:helix-hairpin-helix domain-containing protein n=1 Tax=Streptosporangium sandarakinum TaxID=1260955 RepID=UPI003712C651